MRTKMVPIPAIILALLGVVAVLGVGLFVAFGLASSSGSGESGSREAVSSLSDGGASPFGAPDQQSEPADTTKITPVDQGREQSADPSDQPALTTAVPDPDTGLPLAGSRELVVDVTQFRQLLPRDAILPVYDPRFVPAESASVPTDALVIGVEINGESKAYPVGPLNFREMVNDTVGGVPVLVTW